MQRTQAFMFVVLGCGYVEIRARLPKGQGMWPALWMDEASGNPAAEFDIMEMLGGPLAFTRHSPVSAWHNLSRRSIDRQVVRKVCGVGSPTTDLIAVQ